MCNPLLAALIGLAAGCGAPPAPAGLLAPDDPRIESTFHPPAAPTAGLKRYAPVEARSDWGGAPAKAAAAPAGGAMPAMPDMPGMPGMPGMGDMKGMKGMPGMGGQ